MNNTTKITKEQKLAVLIAPSLRMIIENVLNYNKDTKKTRNGKKKQQHEDI